MGGGSRACVYRRRLCCADFDERIERRRKSITTTGEDNGLRRSERTVICAGVHNDASGYASTSYDREEVWFMGLALAVHSGRYHRQAVWPCRRVGCLWQLLVAETNAGNSGGGFRFWCLWSCCGNWSL